jgi:phenylpropionate dioxygenase-like ring-hydroxylating dioxygenase large terminal subunit
MSKVSSAEKSENAAAQAPAVNRHPGISYQDIIARDRVPPPTVLAHEHYTFLGDQDISADRYSSPDFYNREMDRIWRHVWQWACRVEHIPEAGDYYNYNIGKYSILIVRGANGEIKAFYNNCQHRGTKLRAGEGCGHAAEFQCPFHGWTYRLDGSLKPIPCAWDFPHVKPENFGLAEVRVGLWGGFVFINLDPNAPSLEEYLAPLPEHFRNWDMGKRYIGVHVQKDLPCNWKAAAESFMEQYHLRTTHPQLVDVIADTNTQYDVYGNHVSRFVAAMATPSPEVADPLSPSEIINRMIVGDASVARENLEIGDGESPRSVMAAHLREVLGDKGKTDLSGCSDAEMIDPIQYYVFPNMFVWPGVSIPIVYRMRPRDDSPDKSTFEVLYLRLLPDDGEAPPPPDPIHLGEDESFLTVPGLDRYSAETFDQDVDNLRAQRDGCKFITKGLTLANYQEIRLRHLNRTVDMYLSGELGAPNDSANGAALRPRSSERRSPKK